MRRSGTVDDHHRSITTRPRQTRTSNGGSCLSTELKVFDQVREARHVNSGPKFGPMVTEVIPVIIPVQGYRSHIVAQSNSAIANTVCSLVSNSWRFHKSTSKKVVIVLMLDC